MDCLQSLGTSLLGQFVGSSSSWISSGVFADGSCISASLDSSLGGSPQSIPHPCRTDRGTGPDLPVCSSIWIMLIFLFLDGSRSKYTARKPSDLFSLVLLLTLLSVRGQAGLEMRLGSWTLPDLFFLPLATDGLSTGMLGRFVTT